jgi:YjbE family integral membrane protein
LDAFFTYMFLPAFWLAVVQIIGVNIILSGDNAVVIALACMRLPPRQRMWGMILGAGAAVLLLVVFALLVEQAMSYPYLKFVGGLLLFWVAIKLVTEDAEGEDNIEAAETLWRAVWVVVVADIVMSLDNVIAIAASAQKAAPLIDPAHADSVQAALLLLGLATSVPVIIAGSAILMALLERFRVLVWAGGALLGFIAGGIILTDPAVIGWFGQALSQDLEPWAGRVGAIFVIAVGMLMVRRHHTLSAEDVRGGIGIFAFLIGNMILESLIGESDRAMQWIAQLALVVILGIAYFVSRARARDHSSAAAEPTA